MIAQTASAYHDEAYLDLARRILSDGTDRGDRTGTGTRSLFGQQLRFDLSRGYPLLTTKQVFFKTLIKELLWFLTGSTNIRPLVLQNVHIWNEWPYQKYRRHCGLQPKNQVSQEEWDTGLAEFVETIRVNADFAEVHGELGEVYGSQWRHWKGPDGYTDQIEVLVWQLMNEPESRSHMVTAWNPSEYRNLRENSLPPCHVLWQCYVAEGKLSLHLYQRSCDYFIGVPFNIASYAALCIMLAHVTGLTPGELVWTGGDVHVYNNHMDQIRTQIKRESLPSPTLAIVGDVPDIDSFTLDNFELTGYQHQGKIAGAIAV
jgi:thymidylate synthase